MGRIFGDASEQSKKCYHTTEELLRKDKGWREALCLVRFGPNSPEIFPIPQDLALLLVHTMIWQYFYGAVIVGKPQTA